MQLFQVYEFFVAQEKKEKMMKSDGCIIWKPEQQSTPLSRSQSVSVGFLSWGPAQLASARCLKDNVFLFMHGFDLKKKKKRKKSRRVNDLDKHVEPPYDCHNVGV